MASLTYGGYTIYWFDAGNGFFSALVLLNGKQVARVGAYKTASEAIAAAKAAIGDLPTPTPTPTPSPEPSPVPGPSPNPWGDGDEEGWDVVPVPIDDRGGGTYAGFGGEAAFEGAWTYPSMWFEATSAWGTSSDAWNYASAWSGFTDAGSWDSGGTWDASPAGGGFLSGIVEWFTSLFG